MRLYLIVNIRQARDSGRSNMAFEEDDNHYSSSPVRTPAKARQRQQVRANEALANEFNNAAFEQDDDQQSITPPPPYPCEAATPDGQVQPYGRGKDGLSIIDMRNRSVRINTCMSA